MIILINIYTQMYFYLLTKVNYRLLHRYDMIFYI